MLDLSDECGALCGRLFADLGADVIKVEPPGGCPTRRIPPFLEDIEGSDRSLYFIAYEAGKRSVTLELKSEEGRGLLGKLVTRSDFLVESYRPGYLESLGLGYRALAALNPRLIHASVTPFGETGPGRDYKFADIVGWAAGGPMYLMGEEGRPPLEMSLPQAALLAAAEAAVASLIAHYPRESDGQGQRIVVSVQACAAWTLMNEQAMPILHGNHLKREGVFSGLGFGRRKMVFRCADGFVSALIIGGPTGTASTRALIKWMEERGFATDWMVKKDWENWMPGIMMRATEKDEREIAEVEERVERFCMTLTRRELYEGALERRILLAPVATAADIASDEQLKARGFFVPVEHATLGRTLIFPGPFARLGRTPIGAPRRAPQLGEHNREVYGELLGLRSERLAELAAAGVI